MNQRKNRKKMPNIFIFLFYVTASVPRDVFRNKYTYISGEQSPVLAGVYRTANRKIKIVRHLWPFSHTFLRFLVIYYICHIVWRKFKDYKFSSEKSQQKKHRMNNHHSCSIGKLTVNIHSNLHGSHSVRVNVL